MKVGSRRRRGRQQIEDEKLEAETKRKATEEKLALFDKLKQENAKLKTEQQEETEARQVLNAMLN